MYTDHCTLALQAPEFTGNLKKIPISFFLWCDQDINFSVDSSAWRLPSRIAIFSHFRGACIIIFEPLQLDTMLCESLALGFTAAGCADIPMIASVAKTG